MTKSNREQFVTETDRDVPAITTDHMREVDRIAIEETGPKVCNFIEICWDSP